MPKKEKNPPDWKLCETEKSIEYERQGCVVAPTGRGSDFVAVCPDRKTTLVEVKKGCGSLTKHQKETRERALASGLDYKVERCGCSKRKK
jgi:hypothetical protein